MITFIAIVVIQTNSEKLKLDTQHIYTYISGNMVKFASSKSRKRHSGSKESAEEERKQSKFQSNTIGRKHRKY